MREGWQIKTLGELAVKITDGSHNPPKGVEMSEYLMLSSQNVWNGFLDKSIARHLSKQDFLLEDKRTCAREGDVLLTIVGTIGRTCVLSSKDTNITFQRSVCVIKPKPELNPFFLSYQLQFKNKEINEQANGAAQKGFYLKQVERLPIFITSIPEQQRIVDILDQEFAKIDAMKANAEKSLQAAKDLFQTTLKKELEPKDGWAVAEINSVCLKTDNIKWRDIPEEKEYTYIDLTSVDRSTKSIVEPQRIKKSNAPSRAQRLVCEDDIIFATTRPTLRRYCIIPEQYDEQICSTGFCVLRPDKRKVRPSWLFHCLSTDAFYDYVEPLQTGATYPAITDKDVKGYTISLPTIMEQDDIVSRLNDLNGCCNALQQNYQKTLILCDDLKQSLLRKAFIGEL